MRSISSLSGAIKWHWLEAVAALPFFISRLIGRRHWTVTIRGTSVRLGFLTPLHHDIARQESEKGIEKDVLEQWMQLPGSVVYDIGGYNGLFGIAYAAQYPHSRVTIFEPDQINFSQIQHNIRLNNLANCSVERVALSDTTGTVRFSQGGRSKERIVKEGGSEVPTFPLSHYPPADLMKIDVEGAEGKVLRGLTYPTTIVMELHSSEYLAQYNDTPETIWKRIEELNLSRTLLNDRDSEQHYLLRTA